MQEPTNRIDLGKADYEADAVILEDGTHQGIVTVTKDTLHDVLVSWSRCDHPRSSPEEAIADAHALMSALAARVQAGI